MAKRMTDEDLIELSQKTTLYTEEYVAPLHAQLAAANARIAELEAAIEDSAYSPIEIVPLEDAIDTLHEYFYDSLLWNEPEFVQGRAAVETVRFAINEYDKRIAELEAQQPTPSPE